MDNHRRSLWLTAVRRGSSHALQGGIANFFKGRGYHRAAQRWINLRPLQIYRSSADLCIRVLATMSKLLEIIEPRDRIFAVGDLHGCVDEARLLMEFLVKTEGLKANDQLIFIGDYVDRGPDPKGIIDLMLDVQKRFPDTVFLRGNHEDMLLGFLGFEGTMGDAYLYNGGADTLRSYGLSAVATAEEVGQALPREHLSFLLNLESYVLLDDWVFAHAGLSPLRKLKSQLNSDLFWIRDEFINNIHRFGKTVVFGHTPHVDVLFHPPFKIGIDTGLCYGNRLTCIELRNRRLYQIARGSEEIKVRHYTV